MDDAKLNSMLEDTKTECFVRLLTENQQRILSFIRMLVTNSTDVEEIFQEVSIIAWRKLDRFEAGSDFVRWVNQISYFEVLRHRKKCSRQAMPFNDLTLKRIADEVEKEGKTLDQEKDALQSCLKKLNESDQELIDRRYLRDEPAKVMANSLGRPANSIYRSLQRIRRVLYICIHRVLTAENQK